MPWEARGSLPEDPHECGAGFDGPDGNRDGTGDAEFLVATPMDGPPDCSGPVD